VRLHHLDVLAGRHQQLSDRRYRTGLAEQDHNGSISHPDADAVQQGIAARQGAAIAAAHGLSREMWLFALPALLINALIILVPAVLTLTAAFFFWDGVGTPVWAGLTNFRSLFDDPVFWSALPDQFSLAEILLIP